MIWLCGFMSDPGDAGREPVLETLCRDAREEAHEMEVKTALKRCRGAQRLPGHVVTPYRIWNPTSFVSGGRTRSSDPNSAFALTIDVDLPRNALDNVVALLAAVGKL